jgi:phosphocarrier protein FPr
VDFFSIGTNDLAQYTMAAERGNDAVAGLADGLHPAILRLIRAVSEAAEAHGKWVGVCGELASDPAAVPLLVGLGVSELSVNPPAIPATKEAVRQLDAGAAADLAGEALRLASAEDVRALVAAYTAPVATAERSQP